MEHIGTPPFTDALFPEVAARVCIQLVALEYRRSHRIEKRPAPLIRAALNRLPRDGFPILVTALLGLQYNLLTGKGSAKTWLTIAIEGSRTGAGFRRCFYNDYKANRRR